MGLHLPQSISAYFGADRSNYTTIAGCFAEDATVRDEGKTYVGRKAIQEWMALSSKKYAYTAVPFAMEAKFSEVVVTAKVAGNFPGSPLDLRYFFALAGDKIASLEIKL